MKRIFFLVFSLLFVISCASSGGVKKSQKKTAKDDFFLDSPSSVADSDTTNDKNAKAKGKESGYASWYGGEFQGRPTASGEPYDMYGYTAAHKELPLGSIVAVTNLENGNKVVVRINDRGPFVEGRILDLTKAAAQELDFVEKGTTKVEIEVIRQGDSPYEITPLGQVVNQQQPLRQPEYPQLSQEAQPQKVEPILRSDSGYDFEGGRSPQGYTVQVGAFVVPQNAANYSKKIGEDFGKETFIARKGEWNFVWVGDFPDTQSARNFLKELKQRGVDVMYRGKVD